MTAPTRPAQSRTRYIAAAVVCGLVVVIAIVLLVVLADNVVFYRTVSEAVKERSSQGSSRFRLAGAVVPRTVEGDQGRRRLRGHRRQAHRARRPRRRSARALQAAGAGRVRGALGHVGLTFDSDRILIKHGASTRRRRSTPRRHRRPRAREGDPRRPGHGDRDRRRRRSGIVLLLRGVLRHNAAALRQGRMCVFVVLLGAVVAVGAMEWALISHDFSIRYVADNNARATPLALHDHRALGRARGLDPAVGAPARGVPRRSSRTGSAGASRTRWSAGRSSSA